VNPAAETFLNASKKSLDGHPVWDKIFVDAPLEEAFARIRTGNPRCSSTRSTSAPAAASRCPATCRSRR
jgi:hypothetical protein